MQKTLYRDGEKSTKSLRPLPCTKSSLPGSYPTVTVQPTAGQLPYSPVQGSYPAPTDSLPGSYPTDHHYRVATLHLQSPSRVTSLPPTLENDQVRRPALCLH